MRGLWQHPLPEPVARDQRGIIPDYEESQDHGLWGFFSKDKQPMIVPEEESSHGTFNYVNRGIPAMTDNSQVGLGLTKS
jgi:hypothetical protein